MCFYTLSVYVTFDVYENCSDILLSNINENQKTSSLITKVDHFKIQMIYSKINKFQNSFFTVIIRIISYRRLDKNDVHLLLTLNNK